MKLLVLNPGDYAARRAASDRSLRRQMKRRALRAWALLALVRAAICSAVTVAIPSMWWLSLAIWSMYTAGSLIRALENGLP